MSASSRIEVMAHCQVLNLRQKPTYGSMAESKGTFSKSLRRTGPFAFLGLCLPSNCDLRPCAIGGL